ncbi:hypothetical protein [Halobacteriovorax sp. YZS-1-1]|uniref:hypothetical protein n=1 Tax=unclassified Halobacteriovorax TaxID=2639665 RepID=UPI00399ACD19
MDSSKKTFIRNYIIIMIYLSGLALGAIFFFERFGQNIVDLFDILMLSLYVLSGLSFAHFFLVAFFGAFANFQKLEQAKEIDASIKLIKVRSPYDFISLFFKNANSYGASILQGGAIFYFFPSDEYSTLFVVKVVAVQMLLMLPVYAIYEGFYDIARGRSRE